MSSCPSPSSRDNRLRSYHGPVGAASPVRAGEYRRPRSSTTVAFLMRGSDLLPDSRERIDERRVDRGNTGAVGGIVAGSEGANAPAVHAGTGSGISRSVSGWAAWGGAAQDGLDARRGGG